MKQKFGASLKNKWACLVFVVGLVITALVSYQVETSNNNRIEEAARQSLDNAAESILTRIKLYQYGLRAARGAVLTAGEHDVNRALFHSYSLTRDTDKEFPGARGFGFIRRVHPSDEAEFVEKARADDWPEFSIREITPNSGERYVIQYIEPVERNRAAVGLDIASEQNRYSAANSSMLTGEVRLTGPITLVQATGLPQQSFLMMLPLYRGGKTPDSSAEREKLAFGWSYAPLIMAEVLADQRLDATQVLLSLSDVTEPAHPTMFFSNFANSDSGLYQTKQHRIYGRVWSFNFAVTPLFIKNLQLQSPHVIALIGSLMTLLMAALTGFISVNKMNKQHLHLEQTRLAAVVASSVDGIISTTLDGQILSWNHGAEDIFGYNSEEAVGTFITQLVIPEHFLQEEAKLFQHVAQGGSISNLETVRRKKNDALVDVSVSLSPIYSLDGKVTGVSKTVRDISKQKAAEIKINELNTNLEAQVKERTADLANLNLLFKNVLTAASEFAIIATDVEGKIQLFNTGAEKLLGYTAGEIIQKYTPVLFFKAEEIELRAAALSNQYQESIVGFRVLVHTSEIHGFESSEWLNVRKDGLCVPVSLVVTSMRNEQNEVVGYLCVARDITEQRKQQAELFAAQEQLIATSEQLTLAYQVAELGIWEWDLKDNALHWNDKMYHMYEYPLTLKQEGLQYSHWESRVHPDDRAVTAAKLHGAVAGTAEYEPIFRLSLPSGKTRYIQAAAYVKRDEYGKSVKVIGINRDITSEHELEKSLREAKTAAEVSSTAKSMFLANMSHEIRTPMNAVLGMLQLIKTTELSRQQDDYTSKAQIAAKSLLNLINDILDYSKIEAGKLELECHPFQLDDLMRELAVVLSPNLGKKNVELLFDIDTTLPDVLRGDRLRLQQILVNLAGNAIKFTETGEVVIRLQQLHIQNNNCLLRVSVTDSGIGISHEQQQRIFDGFTQAEASTARKYGGSGLGLVISKQMIHLMGGELQLKSEVGSGSCFWFDVSLPIEVNPVQEDTTHYSIGSDVNVLIVDENEAALEVLAHSVEQFGATVFKARSGEEALTQFTQCMEKKQTIHAVLMDYRMPGMNGLNAAREIKNQGGIEQVPVIAMVTAFGLEEIIHAQQAEDKVFESYLTKPVTAKQLYSLLKQAIAGDEMALSTRILPTQSKLRLQGIHLLLVEDNEFNRLVATELLQNEGATVDVAIGGQEGVDAVLSGVTQYDLVLMDVQMPGIDGLEATKRIRAKSGFAQLPIIAMTANVYLSDQEACLQAGMNAHLGKPLDLEKIIECILHFAKRTSASVPEQPNVIATIKDDTGADHKTLESILKRFGGNATFFRRLITSFETNFEQQLLSLQDVVNKKDWVALLALLHTLKGTSGTAGLSSLYQMVCELETEFKLAHARTEARCETLSVGLVSNLRQLAMSELSDIHRLLATSPAESAATPLVVSTEELNLKLTQLKRYLKAGNLKAIDMAQDLKVILQGNGSVKEELTMMSDAVEALDFEAAIVQLTSLTEKL